MVVGQGLYMVITCCRLTYHPKFPVSRRIQPEITHLTIEIIRIMNLLRLSRERDECSIVGEAHASRRSGVRR
ncbi:hypothetical protein TNCV_1474731 [Trichonephila clavipes]|nr:hypothetical protein TNCV_1474731 [Trichonephila clavipes]